MNASAVPSTSTSTVPVVASSNRSVGPATTSRPPSIITTWSHTFCTSSSRWVAINTEMPNEPSRATSASISSRPGGVEAGGGLVEQHQHRVGHDGLGQLHPLAHAGREPAHGPEPGLVEADQVEHVGRPLAGVAAGRPASSPRLATRSAAVWSAGRQSCSGM